MEVLGGQIATNLISLILVTITGVYVLLTWRISTANSSMLTNMKEQFQETIRPFIITRLTVRHSVFVSLEIENLGRSPATNVSLALDRDFHQFADPQSEKNIRNFEAFRKPIPMIAPQQILRFDLAQGFNMNIENGGKLLTPMEFSVTANYQFKEQRYSDEFRVDIAPLMHTHTPRNATEHLEKMVEHLDKIKDSLKQIERTLGDKR